MSAQANAPIIIKRKKVISGGGHHGGAWKVAYADFVTAMMAFFMLMWLLNATTEQQRKGLADYFAPAIPLSRVSGGGDGLFGGDDVMSRNGLPESSDGPSPPSGADEIAPAASPEDLAAASAEVEALNQIEELLMGVGGEALLSEEALRHVVTRLTDEGLVIEIFSLPGAPIFEDGGTEASAMLRELVQMIARVSSVISNPVAVAGHVSARPIVLADNPVWDISGARADQVRRILEGAGLDAARLDRLTGHGDRMPATGNPLEERNDRIEITLLRTMR